MKKQEQQFKGFDLEPSTWNFPMNINGWVHKLTGAEFKVLWYILRHTWGWQKDSDTISQKQFKYGIKKKDGKWIDNGTGLGEGTIKIAIKGLVEKGFIETKQEKDEKGRYRITEYSPKYAFPPTETRTAEKRLTTNTNVNKQILNNNNSVAKQSFANPNINNFIELFKSINPTYERLFSNKSQRASADRLLKKFGKDKMFQLMENLEKIVGKPYAPRITTPYQLEQKFGDLIFYFKEQSEIKVNFIDLCPTK